MKPKFKKGDKVRILDGSNIAHYTGGWAFLMRKLVGDVVTIKRVDKAFTDRVAYEMCEVGFTWDERGLELVKDHKMATIITDDSLSFGNVIHENDKKIVVEKDAYYKDNKVEISKGLATSFLEIGLTGLDLKPKENPTIVKVIYDNNDTIVYWSDDTKTKVTCQTGDRYDKEKGLAMAIAKKYLGNGHDYYETFKKHLDDVTFRFLAVKDDPDYFTKGKVYEAVNGQVTYDDGYKGNTYNSFEDYLTDNPSWSNYIVELKEGDDPKEILKQYEKPKRYSGRVVCIENSTFWITVGKIYEVKDGVLTYDDGTKSTPRDGESFSEWSKHFASKFIEIKEDK